MFVEILRRLCLPLNGVVSSPSSLNPVAVSDLDQEVLKEVMAENCGLTLLDLKKRSEYPLVTTTSAESYDEFETPAVSPALDDADNRLSEIASAIPPVNLEMLTVKHIFVVESVVSYHVVVKITQNALVRHTNSW